MSLPAVLLSQARKRLREEGAGALVRASLRRTRRGIIRYRTVDVFRCFLAELAQVPAPDRVEVRTVTSLDQGRREAARFLDALLAWDIATRRRLARGAEAIVALAGGEIAHVVWVARTAAGKATIDGLPYPVDFAAGEGCLGGGITAPRWRRRGIGAFTAGRALRHLAETGCRVARYAIEINNAASLRMLARFDPRRVARMRALRLLDRELRLSYRELDD